MAFQQKDMTGVLFKNDKKTEAKHPDYRGSVTIQGTEWQLAGWIKDGRGGKFLSLSAQAKRVSEPTESKPPATTATPPTPPADDSLPF